MSESPVYRPHPEEPAVATLRAETASDAWGESQVQRFEVVSRGDFVPGILYRPNAARPPKDETTPGLPLLLVQHAAGDDAEADYLACAAPWVGQGLAVASIDLALHGQRSSPKLSDRLIDGIRQLSSGTQLDAETAALVEEFARQTTSDLIRTLDALAALPEIDGERVGFMGFGVGAIAGSYLLAHEPRVRAFVLALAGGGRGPVDLDPTTYLERAGESAGASANRRVLIVAPEKPGRLDQADVDAFYQAAPEPKERLRVAGRDRRLPKKALAEIERFLRASLNF